MIHILINDFYFGIKKMILTIKTRIEPINVIKNHINININNILIILIKIIMFLIIIILITDDLKLYVKNEKSLESLVQTVRIFFDDTVMEFGIHKCAILVQNRGKISNFYGISLPDGRVVK